MPTASRSSGHEERQRHRSELGAGRVHRPVMLASDTKQERVFLSAISFWRKCMKLSVGRISPPNC